VAPVAALYNRTAFRYIAIHLLIRYRQDKRSTAVGVLLVELGHVLLAQLKPVNICVLRDAIRVVALGERHPVLLQAVSQQDR
jgi:hypothetical protein